MADIQCFGHSCAGPKAQFFCLGDKPGCLLKKRAKARLFLRMIITSNLQR